MENKNIKRLLKDSEDSCLISTKNGTGVIGGKVSILLQFVMLVRNLRQVIPDGLLRKVFESTFKTEEQLAKEMKDMSKKEGNN